MTPPAWPAADQAPATPPPPPMWAAPNPATGPDASATPTSAFSPARLPTSEWARSAGPGSGGSPEAWFEPVPTRPVPTDKQTARPRGLAASIVTASLLSAVLASGGTLVALNASGVLDRPAAPASANVQPIIVPAGGADQSSIVAAAARVSPAVVQITSVAGINPNDVSSLPDTGVGSGVIFDSNGWILTNRHVVSGSDKITVALKDGRTFTGTIYGIDTLTDLAIVKLDATGLPAAAMGDSSALQVGQLAIAIGSPLGTYTNSVTSGIVSALGRSITIGSTTLNNLIQTDASINPGNSGGPLVDAKGTVIGIDTATASGAQGIGFAIPIDIAKPLLQQALAGEKLARPWIGIRYQAITPALVKERSLPVDHGALVGPGQDQSGASLPGITPGSPAAKAGIKEGDIVTSVEGMAVDSLHPLDSIMIRFAPGRTVTLEVYRGGSTLKLQVTLGTRPANL
ncbi:MAG: trypsin-like peptidase domain-containing protein [Chloroflexota bacterium]|nr:trypsin-like peptidase domain-containing protein [Chloroflexota bacterium]